MGKIFGEKMFTISKISKHNLDQPDHRNLVTGPYTTNESMKIPFAFGNGKNDGKGGTATDPS